MATDATFVVFALTGTETNQSFVRAVICFSFSFYAMYVCRIPFNSVRFGLTSGVICCKTVIFEMCFCTSTENQWLWEHVGVWLVQGCAIVQLSNAKMSSSFFAKLQSEDRLLHGVCWLQNVSSVLIQSTQYEQFSVLLTPFSSSKQTYQQRMIRMKSYFYIIYSWPHALSHVHHIQ